MRSILFIYFTLQFFIVQATEQADIQFSKHRWRPGYDTRKIGNKL